jgi:uncharacterized protein (TIGR03118 family)
MTSARHRNIRRKIKGIAIGTIALLTMTVPMLSTSATAQEETDGYLVTFLVSDLPQIAAKTHDPNLVNPWGVATSATSPFWVSDNNAGVATLYNTSGSIIQSRPRVSIPNPVDICGAVGTPTGVVFNITVGTPQFVISSGATSGPARFLFATEDGTIVGWNPGVNPDACVTQADGTSITGIIAVDNSGNNFTNPDPASQTGAVYKGLAIATDSSGRTLLYATNFRAGKVDVFGPDFKPPVPALPAGAFTDPSLPAGYAPFNIVEIGGKLVVTYAKQDANRHDDVAGQGNGFVNIFNLDGSGLQRFAEQGQLNSPWGVALAPAGFGQFAGDLLIGNFGNGLINAFDLASGRFLGMVSDPNDQAIAIDGLWTLRVGNGAAGGDVDKVYFTAGLFGETHGLFGSLSAATNNQGNVNTQ